MQTDRYQVESIKQSLNSGPKRSLSYNDLKKKRLIRSQKSRSKLNPTNKQTLSISRTQKKKIVQNNYLSVISAPNTPYDSTKLDKCINQLKDVFAQIKQKTKTKKNVLSKPFYTDRSQVNKKPKIIGKTNICNYSRNSFFASIQMAGNEKDLIKQIISKKKSQRRLLKFEQIRNQVKRSKSKSNSKQKKHLNQVNQNQQDTRYKQKALFSINKNTSQQKPIKHLRVNKFETINQNQKNIICNGLQVKQQCQAQVKQQCQAYSSQKYSRKAKPLSISNNQQAFAAKQSSNKMKFHRKLKKSNSEIVIIKKQPLNKQTQLKININQIKQTNIKQVNIEQTNINQINRLIDFNTDLQQINISCIQVRKDANSFVDIQSCINIVQTIEDQEIQNDMQSYTDHKIQNAQNIADLSNLLDLIALPTQQLKLKVKKSNKLLRKKSELDKFKKIFPKNFFKD